MDKLHSHNYLIVLVGTIALSVMTFFSEGINIRAFIGIGIMLASLIATELPPKTKAYTNVAIEGVRLISKALIK